MRELKEVEVEAISGGMKAFVVILLAMAIL